MANEGELGQALIAFRRSAGFSQQQLAERSGIAPSTISDIERGISRVPRPSTLLVLAQTLGLSGDEHKLLLAAGAGPDAADEQASHAEEFETLAAALARLRTLASLSVPDLADRSHVSLRTIRNVEKGRTVRVQPLTARQLANALGLTDPERRDFLALAVTGSGPVRAQAVAGEVIPTAPAELHGRVAEYAQLLKWLAGPGLVTITGPGGVGKTALAAAAVRAFAGPSSPLEFASLPHGTGAISALAALTGLDDGPADVVIGQWAGGLDEGCLLLLDNVEHLTDPAGLVEGLLNRRDDIRVLVTSRFPLDVAGDRILALTPLDPDAARTMFEAVASRAAGAASASSPQEPAAEGGEVIDRICARLDGLPLAIELAAAWAGMLTPHDILTQLDHPGHLLRRPDAAPDRQASIADTVSWSMHLLSDGATTLFLEMSVYPAAWPLHLIEAVHPGAGLLQNLRELTRCGLLRVDQAGQVSRFGMLETVRDAARAVAETRHLLVADTLGRHAGHLTRRAAGLEPGLKGADAAATVALLGDDLLHYEAALQYLTGIADPRAVDLSASLWRYWQRTGKYKTGLSLIRAALQACEDDRPRSLAECRYGAGVLAYLSGEVAAAVSYARSALQLFREAGDIAGTGAVMSLLGMINLHQGNVDASIQWYTDGLQVATWQAAPRVHATLLSGLAVVREQQADLAAASELAEEAAIRYRLLGDMASVAAQLGNLANWSADMGDTERARELLNEARQMFAEQGDHSGLREVYLGLAAMALNEGAIAAAASALGQANEHGTKLDDPWGDATAASYAAELLLHDGHLAEAVREAQIAGSRATEIGWRPAQIRAWLVQAVCRARQGRTTAAVEAARSGLALCTDADSAAITSLSLLIVSQLDSGDGAARVHQAAAIAATVPGRRPYAMISLIAPPRAHPATDGARQLSPTELRDLALAVSAG